MDYISTKEAAEKWGVSLRHVQRMIKDKRIFGARKYGNYWMVPGDAQKPADLRRMRDEPEDIRSPYLGCVLLSSVIPMPNDNPDAVLASLPDELQRAQYQAELDYLRCDFEAVKAYYSRVSPKDVTYLCAANITICAAMSTRDYPLFLSISAEIKEIEKSSASSEARRVASLLFVLAGVSMNAPQIAPDWLVKGEFEGFPTEARPMLIFMRIKYLQSVGDNNAMLAAAQIAREIFRQDGKMTLVDIYLACFCACACYALGRLDEAREYLSISVAECERGWFVSPLGEYSTWVGGLLATILRTSTPDFERAVDKHIEGILKNWLFFHNEFAKDNVTLILTTKEYQLALLLKEGKTYAQSAKQLHISVGRCKNLISVIYQKLGISKKSELKNYLF